MSHLVKLIQSFSKDESGAALVEYAVIFAVLVAGTVASLTAISGGLADIFTQVAGVMTALFP
jgi:Flp pilus assembly pilin Flp